jgi:hypothetical protein
MPPTDKPQPNFSVPNHGKLWKSLMRVHLGEYEACKAELKRIAHDMAAIGYKAT